MKTVRYQFNKGVNGLAERRMIPAGQCVFADNVDLRNGTMRPMRIPRLLSTDVPVGTRDIFEYRGKWYYGSHTRSYAAEFVGAQERLYVTELGSDHPAPKKFIDGHEAFLGTMRPVGKPVISLGDPIYPPTLTIEFEEGAGSLTEGSYTYRVAFKTEYGIQPPSVPITGQVPKGKAGGFRIKWKESSLASTYYIYGRKADSMGKLSNTKETSFLDNGAFSQSDSPELRGFVNVQYITTWVREFRGHVNESGPSLLSDGYSTAFVRKIKRPDHNVLGATEQGADFTWKWRIYRTGDVGGWNLVKECDFETLEFVDFMTSEFLGFAPESIYVENDIDVVFDTPPTDLTGITLHYNMLFGISGNSVRWTPIGEPDAWPAVFRINFQQRPVALVSYAGFLVVLCLDRPYIINGFQPTSLTRMGTLVEEGCIAPYSVQVINNRLHYLSRRGVMAFDGQNAVCITDNRISPLHFLAPSKMASAINSWILPSETTFNYASLVGREQGWIGAGSPSGNSPASNANNNSIEGPIFNIKSFVAGGKYILYWSNFI